MKRLAAFAPPGRGLRASNFTRYGGTSLENVSGAVVLTGTNTMATQTAPDDLTVTAFISGVFPAVSATFYSGIIFRSNFNDPYLEGYLAGWRVFNSNLGGIVVRRFFPSSSADPGVVLEYSPVGMDNTWFSSGMWIKINAAGTTLSVKAWQGELGDEPGSYGASTTDANWTTGGAGIVCHDATSVSLSYWSVT